MPAKNVTRKPQFLIGHRTKLVRPVGVDTEQWAAHREDLREVVRRMTAIRANPLFQRRRELFKGLDNDMHLAWGNETLLLQHRLRLIRQSLDSVEGVLEGLSERSK
jgi:hypothetical protein